MLPPPASPVKFFWCLEGGRRGLVLGGLQGVLSVFSSLTELGLTQKQDLTLPPSRGEIRYGRLWQAVR